VFTLFATHGPFEHLGLMLLLLGWGVISFWKKNPNVQDAAKKAAANKAISFIERFFK